MKNAATRLAILAGLAVLSTACSPATKQPSPMVSITPPVTQAPAPVNNPASLFSQAAQPSYLYEDNRARHIGDIVMINIVEKSNAQNKAKTKSKITTDTTNIGVANYFQSQTIDPFPGSKALRSATGVDVGALTGMKGKVGSDPIVSATRTNQFDADGETSRQQTVTATVGCRVVNILPGGVMQVEGARQVRVNDDTQIIVVRGLVRPMDIGPDNSINSTSVAECQIDLYGVGVLADRQKPGWLSRILDNIWPF